MDHSDMESFLLSVAIAFLLGVFRFSLGVTLALGAVSVALSLYSVAYRWRYEWQRKRRYRRDVLRPRSDGEAPRWSLRADYVPRGDSLPASEAGYGDDTFRGSYVSDICGVPLRSVLVVCRRGGLRHRLRKA